MGLVETSAVCQCTQPGFCPRIGRNLGQKFYSYCQAGRSDLVDDVYRQSPVACRLTGPTVSTIGDELIAAIQQATGEKIKCGECRSYLTGFNRTQTVDAEAIVATYVSLYDIPRAIREIHLTREQQAEWLRPIVARAIANSVLIQPRATRKRKEPDGRNWPAISAIVLSESIRHLCFHLWPVASTGVWRWHIEQLAERWMLWNGCKVISIATDRHTVSADEVLAYGRTLGVQWDTVIVGDNHGGLGEVQFWNQKLASLPPAELNHVVMYGHGKGVQERTNTQAVRLWTQLMYEAACDYWPAVRSILETKLTCGSLRRLDHYRIPGNFRWHYSGTFFWFRWSDVQARKFEFGQRERSYWKYVGTEAWPGRVARRDEGGVLFLDAMRHSLYDLPTMIDVVWPMWDAWKKQNHHNRTEDVVCSIWGVNFARYLPAGSVRGKDVVEVGARDVNGSCRPLVMQRFPRSYISTEMDSGPGVDLVCTGQELPERLGTEAADVLICTEVLEHVLGWREFVAAIWSVLRPGGVLLLTTRSPGFPYHEFPSDHWRFTVNDMLTIFGGQELLTVTADPTEDPGVGVIVRKRSDDLGLQECEPFAMVAPKA